MVGGKRWGSQGCVEDPDKKAEADRIAQDDERRKNLGLNRNQYKKYTAIEEELKIWKDRQMPINKKHRPFGRFLQLYLLCWECPASNNKRFSIWRLKSRLDA